MKSHSLRASVGSVVTSDQLKILLALSFYFSMKIVISATLEFVRGKDEITLDACTKLYVLLGRMYVRLYMHPAKFRLFLTHDLVRAVLILTRYGIRQVPARKRLSGKISILNSSTILHDVVLWRVLYPSKDENFPATTRGIDKNWSMEAASNFQFKVERRTVPFSRIFSRHYENGRYFSKCLQIEITMLATFLCENHFYWCS